MNKTKIIATIGPGSSSKESLKEMILAGANVCRINFSHGSHADHLKVIESIRDLNTELKNHTAILADLQGPKLRIGEIENNSFELKRGDILTFSTLKCLGSSKKVFMTYESFPMDVQKGDEILIDDGKLVLKAISSNKKDEVEAEVVQGGVLSSNKGVNLPNTKISLPCLTEKDLNDLEFALKNDIAWIGLSFVRSARDIIELKEIIKQKNAIAKVVAKIEKPEAISDIDDIVEETDALMVARGDLGVEVPLQEVPILQKMLVEKARKASKPVIIATQMMESMMESLTPSRAEVSDVANAVTDGADAVMLSGETSVGKHPVAVIRTMSKIVAKAETYEGIYYKEQKAQIDTERFITDSICYNSCRLAENIAAKAIVTMTFSGYTSFKIASYRPKASIFVFTSNHKILNMLSLIWGVRGFYYDKFVSTDHTIADIQFILKKNNLIQEKDMVIHIASTPIAEKGGSNMLKLSQI